jgi:hypothetical protein
MLELGVGGRRFKPAMAIQGGYCIVTTEGAPRELTGVPIERLLLTAIE